MTPDFCIRRSAYVGLAIHHERLSMIKLDRKKQTVIEGFAAAAIPLEEWVHHPHRLVPVVKRLAQTCKANRCFAALGLPSSQIMSKRIRVPAYLNDQERAAEIHSHLNYYFPEADEPLYFDFVQIEQHEQETELKLVAARSKQVAAYARLIRSVGLALRVIDVDTDAAARGIQSITNKQIVIHPSLNKEKLYTRTSEWVTALGLALHGGMSE